MPRALAAAVASILLSLSAAAAAQGGEESGEEEGMTQLDALSLELGVKKSQLADQLQAGDCATACEALASMQRAADRICALEPGPICDRAKRDVDDARARVRAACPDCVLAREEGKEVRAGEQPEPKPTPGRDRIEEQEALDEDRAVPTAGGAQPADAPPAEDARGCAACAIGESPSDGGHALGWLALGAASFLARRRRRSGG